MSRVVRTPVFGSDKNRAVEPQEMARGLKVRVLNLLCSENKGADQLRAAALIIVFAYVKSRFSHDAAQSMVNFSRLEHTYLFERKVQFVVTR